MNYPVISIIVRTYNRPHLLMQALHSLVAQSYRPLEIVIINDGGIDVTDIVHKFKLLYEHLILHQLPQQMGRAVAANNGLKLANGQYIGFLDDDDLLDINHISALYAAINQYSVQAVYSGVRVVKYDDMENENPVTEFCVPFDGERLYAENFIPIHAMLFSRKFIDVGCQFDNKFELFEDWDFWLQLSQHTNFYFTGQITATYRIIDQSNSLYSLTNRYESAIRIYTKWLSDWSIARLYKLLARMQEFKDTTISALQSYNEIKLQEIGEKHAYACQIVEERDRQLQEFAKQHAYACQIVEERDRQLQEFAKQHEYAVKIINERDNQIQQLNIKLNDIGNQHTHALQVINEKDALLSYIQTHPLHYGLKRFYKKLQHIIKLK